MLHYVQGKATTVTNQTARQGTQGNPGNCDSDPAGDKGGRVCQRQCARVLRAKDTVTVNLRTDLEATDGSRIHHGRNPHSDEPEPARIPRQTFTRVCQLESRAMGAVPLQTTARESRQTVGQAHNCGNHWAPQRETVTVLACIKYATLLMEPRKQFHSLRGR